MTEFSIIIYFSFYLVGADKGDSDSDPLLKSFVANCKQQESAHKEAVDSDKAATPLNW